MRPNYAFKPIAEQALRSNESIVPQRLNAALDFVGCVSLVVSAHRGFVARLPRRGARRKEFVGGGKCAQPRTLAGGWSACQRCRPRARYKL